METFLYLTRGEKAERPHISYKIEDVSARNLFYLPISAVLLFNGLSGEINNRGNIDFSDNKRAEIIDKFKRSKRKKSFGQIFKPIKKTKDFNILLLDLEIPLKDFKG